VLVIPVSIVVKKVIGPESVLKAMERDLLQVKRSTMAGNLSKELVIVAGSVRLKAV